MKGQYSLDFMLTLAGFMAFFLVISGVSVNIGNTFISHLGARDSFMSARVLSDHINSLCLLGEGSKEEFTLYFPVETRIDGTSVLVVKAQNRAESFDLNCQTNIHYNLKGRYTAILIKGPSWVRLELRRE